MVVDRFSSSLILDDPLSLVIWTVMGVFRFKRIKHYFNFSNVEEEELEIQCKDW